jgi:hypothetical protein
VSGPSEAPAWGTPFLSEIEKATHLGGLFLSYSLLLEYQVQGQNRPNIIGLFGVEAVLNQRLNFGTVGKKLDKLRVIGDQRSAISDQRSANSEQ